MLRTRWEGGHQPSWMVHTTPQVVPSLWAAHEEGLGGGREPIPLPLGLGGDQTLQKICCGFCLAVMWGNPCPCPGFASFSLRCWRASQSLASASGLPSGLRTLGPHRVRVWGSEALRGSRINGGLNSEPNSLGMAELGPREHPCCRDHPSRLLLEAEGPAASSESPICQGQGTSCPPQTYV